MSEPAERQHNETVYKIKWLSVSVVASTPLQQRQGQSIPKITELHPHRKDKASALQTHQVNVATRGVGAVT